MMKDELITTLIACEQNIDNQNYGSAKGNIRMIIQRLCSTPTTTPPVASTPVPPTQPSTTPPGSD